MHVPRALGLSLNEPGKNPRTGVGKNDVYRVKGDNDQREATTLISDVYLAVCPYYETLQHSLYPGVHAPGLSFISSKWRRIALQITVKRTKSDRLL